LFSSSGKFIQLAAANANLPALEWFLVILQSRDISYLQQTLQDWLEFIFDVWPFVGSALAKLITNQRDFAGTLAFR
jgi:hypothetical protein